MSEIWNFKCLKCDDVSGDGLNHGDKILLNVLKHVDSIKTLLDGDEYGYLQISIMGSEDSIGFLMQHYGEGHDVVVHSEYGKIKRVNEN